MVGNWLRNPGRGDTREFDSFIRLHTSWHAIHRNCGARCEGFGYFEDRQVAGSSPALPPVREVAQVVEAAE